MKVRKNMIAIMALLCMGCVGCTKGQPKTDAGIESGLEDTGNTENEIESEDTKSAADKQDFPDKFQETINGVTFDTKIQISEEAELGNLHQATATLQRPDIEKIKAVFAAGRTAVEERNETGSGEDGMEYPCYTAYYEDGAFLHTSMVLNYSTPVFEKIYGAFRFRPDFEYNAVQYSKDTVLEIGDPEKIFDSVLKNINGAGYQLDSAAYDYYALDHETMEKEYKMLDKSGEELSVDNISWGAGDDCYFYMAVQQHEGLPVYFGSSDFPEDEESNRPVQVLYSANGIERLEVSQLYSFSEPGEPVSLLDFGRIAETVSKKYGDVIGTSYMVTRAELYKMPVKLADSTYDLKIVWLFEVIESGTDSDTGRDYEYTQYMFVDATDGTEVFSDFR
ncbi:MAG: hypothetical protein K2O16_07710 [Lachnospiraceae bacterium]|nr:hypothetical protein [Lachnospiraceae bacterium]